MTTEDNKTIVRRFLETVFSKESETAGRHIDPSFIYHDPSTGELHGLDDIERLFSNFHSRYPDLSITIEELLDAENDQVVARYTMYGTHQGDDKRVAAEGISISRIYDGKIQEMWVNWDVARWVFTEMGRPDVAMYCWFWFCLGPPDPQEQGGPVEEQGQ